MWALAGASARARGQQAARGRSMYLTHRQRLVRGSLLARGRAASRNLRQARSSFMLRAPRLAAYRSCGGAAMRPPRMIIGRDRAKRLCATAGWLSAGSSTRREWRTSRPEIIGESEGRRQSKSDGAAGGIVSAQPYKSIYIVDK